MSACTATRQDQHLINSFFLCKFSDRIAIFISVIFDFNQFVENWLSGLFGTVRVKGNIDVIGIAT